MKKSEEILEKHIVLNDCIGYLGSDGRLYKAIIDALNEAINYTRCSTPLKRESKSFFNVKNLADLKRLYPNRDSYNADVCDGYIKYYVDNQLVITTALMV